MKLKVYFSLNAAVASFCKKGIWSVGGNVDTGVINSRVSRVPSTSVSPTLAASDKYPVIPIRVSPVMCVILNWDQRYINCGTLKK